MIEIIPAIIPKSYRDVEDDVAKVKGHVRRVQIDVMDGKYSPEASWPYNDTDLPQWRDLVDQQRGLPGWELLDFEIDMMVTQPEEKIHDWISAGASTVIIHKHSTDDETLERIITEANERNAVVAIALKPSTSNDELAPYIDRIGFIQCMGNDSIGFHGVEFDEAVLDKIRDITSRWDIPVGVDIGVNFETAPRMIEAGATRLVSGSAIFSAQEGIQNAINMLSRVSN